MLPAALLSLGFPKPPDYSVLSRRLSSLQSDEVCAGSVCAGKLSYPRDDLTRVSMHSFIYLFIYSSIRLPRPPSRACCSTACCHASVPRSSSCLRWRRCCAQSSGRRGSARSSFSAWTADAARYSAAASRCAPPRRRRSRRPLRCLRPRRRPAPRTNWPPTHGQVRIESMSPYRASHGYYSAHSLTEQSATVAFDTMLVGGRRCELAPS